MLVVESNTYWYFAGWSALWFVTLLAPPGFTSIPSTYRLHFVHGVVCTVMALLSIYEVVPESAATMSTISYFIVDFIKNLLNDFIFQVKGYQTPSARKLEYAHHIMCCSVGVILELHRDSICHSGANAFIKFMFAEVSTPFLMIWRVYPEQYLGWLFAFVFFLNRLVYHGMLYIPEAMQQCYKYPWLAWGFAVPYNLMNLAFFYLILSKLFRKQKTLTNDGKKLKD